tara:strand:+ start:872 stop:1363 length:492 start_codon:yes stop_codon:yes gene_type:complete
MIKTELLENVENLVAYNRITSPFGSLYKRLDRKYRELGKQVYEGMVKGNKLPKESLVDARLHWEDTSMARSYTLALKEFKQVDPKAYGKFMEIKKKHTNSRRNYVMFGLLDGKELPKDIYLEIMGDVGLNEEGASKIYDSLMDFSRSLDKKKKENLEKLLVKI